MLDQLVRPLAATEKTVGARAALRQAVLHRKSQNIGGRPRGARCKSIEALAKVDEAVARLDHYFIPSTITRLWRRRETARVERFIIETLQDCGRRRFEHDIAEGQARFTGI